LDISTILVFEYYNISKIWLVSFFFGSKEEERF